MLQIQCQRSIDEKLLFASQYVYKCKEAKKLYNRHVGTTYEW